MLIIFLIVSAPNICMMRPKTLIRMPKGSVWIVVGAAALVVFLIRVVGRNE